MTNAARDTAVTQRIAEFARIVSWRDLPETVQHESVRSLVNWVGCALGGCTAASSRIALEVAREFSGPPSATVIGRGRLVDPVNAAFLNCLASSAHAFDDTHLATVTHPTGPVAAALLAVAERQPVEGSDFLAALALGIEVECRLGNALVVPPAQGNVGWYLTGVTGGIAAALAVANVLGLDQERTVCALGIAAAQAAGFRQTHATMSSSFVPAHAARSGLQAALLAEKGFTCSPRILEGPNGFFDVFAEHANVPAAVDGLGEQWEMLTNTYKPYPCGIVIHPAIDAALEIVAQQKPDPASIEAVDVTVNPLCLTLCDRPAPADGEMARVSMQHWVAASLVRGAAGLAEGGDECVRDPDVIAVRDRVKAMPSEALDRDAARVAIALRDGRRLERTVEHGRGSLARPLSDPELDAKFMAQGLEVLPEARARELLQTCRDVASMEDVSRLAARSFV